MNNTSNKLVWQKNQEPKKSEWISKGEVVNGKLPIFIQKPGTKKMLTKNRCKDKITKNLQMQKHTARCGMTRDIRGL